MTEFQEHSDFKCLKPIFEVLICFASLCNHFDALFIFIWTHIDMPVKTYILFHQSSLQLHLNDQSIVNIISIEYLLQSR